MVAIALAAKRNVKKKTDDILNVWYPPLPNNGKVKVTIMAGDTETVYFLDHYHTLNIEPFVEYNGNKNYLAGMSVNDEYVISTPKLYLDDHINDVVLYYVEITSNQIGFVVESLFGDSFTNYLPQFGTLFFDYSFPRASIYKGIKFGQTILDKEVFAFPIDLDKEDFEMWNNGIKFTLHLNRDNKLVNKHEVLTFFDIVKAEFYGELLPPEEIDDYVELKPKGV